ncbi:MAG: FeoA family protein [Ignavibacteriaceae bacterium]|nr:FeoA family protein [Ignavibacteriaceae bacterium]
MKTAADLKYGETGIISGIDGSHPSSRRILEVGFTPGQEIELISKAVFNDPLAFSVRGTIIAVRKNEASCIKLL